MTIEMKEGVVKVITQECKRQECEECGEVATHQLTFLLPNARSNPASNGYGKDDISWCSDEKMFVCDEHVKAKYELAEDRGMEWCSSYPYKNFQHMFLYWETIKEKQA